MSSLGCLLLLLLLFLLCNRQCSQRMHLGRWRTGLGACATATATTATISSAGRGGCSTTRPALTSCAAATAERVASLALGARLGRAGAAGTTTTRPTSAGQEQSQRIVSGSRSLSSCRRSSSGTRATMPALCTLAAL